MTIRILLLFSFLFLFFSVDAFDITQILSQYSYFKIFNDYLTRLRVAEDINSRETITVFVVENNNLAPLLGLPDDTVGKILRAHVVLDYYDIKRIQNIQGKTKILTTLFQTTGRAIDQQGFLNVTKMPSGKVAIGSAVEGAPLNIHLVRPILAQPYDISVLQISDAIIPLGMNSKLPSSTPAPQSVASPNNSLPPSPTPAGASSRKSLSPSPSPTPTTAPSRKSLSPSPAPTMDAKASPGMSLAPSPTPSMPNATTPKNSLPLSPIPTTTAPNNSSLPPSPTPATTSATSPRNSLPPSPTPVTTGVTNNSLPPSPTPVATTAATNDSLPPSPTPALTNATSPRKPPLSAPSPANASPGSPRKSLPPSPTPTSTTITPPIEAQAPSPINIADVLPIPSAPPIINNSPASAGTTLNLRLKLLVAMMLIVVTLFFLA